MQATPSQSDAPSTSNDKANRPLWATEFLLVAIPSPPTNGDWICICTCKKSGHNLNSITIPHANSVWQIDSFVEHQGSRPERGT